MNAGLADADLLAHLILAGLADPNAAAAQLRRYEERRTFAFDHQIRGLTNSLETMETLPAWARNLVFSAIGVARAAGIERVVARKLSMLTA